MGIRIGELIAAVQRYQEFVNAQAKADPAVVAQERLRLGVANAVKFTSSADRLSVLANAIGKQAQAAPGAAPPVEVPPALLDSKVASREVMFSDNDMRPIRYLQVAALAARAVGKLTVRGLVDEEGDATGFLVAPGLLLTNHHVLPDSNFAAVSFVAFDYEDDIDGRPKAPKLFDLLPKKLYVSDEVLDYCFVAVSPTTAQGEPLNQFGYLKLFEGTGKVDPNRRQAANIIQHPMGQGKKVVVRDNYFAEPPKDALDAARVQNSLFYGADTLKGSSGSPVCTDEWYVVALHRGGVPKIEKMDDGTLAVKRRDGTFAREGDAKSSIHYEANEGTRVSRLYASLKEKAAAGGDDATSAVLALQKISEVATDPRTGPVDRQTAPIVLPARAQAEEEGIEERLVRRAEASLSGLEGYAEAFLGSDFPVRHPALGSEVVSEVAALRSGGGHHLHYLHYSVVMHARRRTAIYAACNVDGAQLWKVVNPGTSVGKRPSAWSIDPRLDETFQPDDSIFSNALQRGHLFKREDAAWGPDDDHRRFGDQMSFMITNATPMIGNFNNVEWGDLEDIITKHLLLGSKISYFAGPIFSVEDPYYNELKRGVSPGEKRRGMRLPTRFWKVVAWVEGNRLKAAGFILDQSDEIHRQGPLTEEISFGKYKLSPISEIERRTGLQFMDLRTADTFA